MSCLEHRRCPPWNTGDVLLETQEMSCLEQRRCPAWAIGDVLLGTQEMSCVENTRCPAWNTKNVLLGPRMNTGPVRSQMLKSGLVRSGPVFGPRSFRVQGSAEHSSKVTGTFCKRSRRSNQHSNAGDSDTAAAGAAASTTALGFITVFPVVLQEVVNQ